MTLTVWSLVGRDLDRDWCRFSFVQVDRFLYVLGGVHKGHLLNSVEKYDLDKNQWTKVAMVPFKLRYGRTPVTTEVAQVITK